MERWDAIWGFMAKTDSEGSGFESTNPDKIHQNRKINVAVCKIIELLDMTIFLNNVSKP
jgi:hypothetical protein